MKLAARIAIDARFMLRPLRGIPLYVLRLCEHLPKLRPDYQFIYFINKGFEHNDTPENYLPRIDAITSANPNVAFINYDDEAEIKWEQLALPQLVKKYHVDLLHMPGNRICFFPGVPTVVTLHDVMEYMYLWQRYKKNIKNNISLKMLFYTTRIATYSFLIYKVGFKRAKKIITVSRYSAEDISLKLKLNKDEIVPIFHGLDVEYICNKFIPYDKRSFTLMLGGDSYQKNPEVAIRAWAKVESSLRKKYPLKIYGFCGNEESILLKAIKENDLADEVEVNGWISQENMVRNFRSAALFIFPSRYEGFGFPLIQAMASGTPVISSNTSSIPEVLGEVGFQFDPDDFIGMAKAANFLLSDEIEWQQQSELGVKRAKQFDWENSAEKHIKLYEEFL